tara:strand:- start:4982 stop:7024 length:2043 start_codon:yes stop_codon:yes gene_type:complete
MSRVTVYQSDFSSGEIDPLFLGRIDLDQYKKGLEEAKNVIVLPQGGFERRPGTRFMLDLTSHLGSGISATTGIRLIPFEFSTTQSYMLAFVKYSTGSSNNVRMFVFANKVQITAINGGSDAYLQVSMGDIDLSKLNYTQSADTLILVHEDMAPISIVRGGSDATWTAATISLTIPKHAFTLGKSEISGNVTPSATSGSITLTSAGSSFLSAHVDQYFTRDDGFGRVRIVEFVSTSEVIGVVEVPFLNTTAIADSAHHIENGYEDAWSASKGYPRSATFHEGRLYFGGSKSLPNTLFGSKVNDFFNFKQTQALDDDAINAGLSSDRVNAITGLFAARDLQIFTTGGEFFVQQTEITPITPTNLTVKSATKNGSKEGIRPVQTADATLFIDRNGGGLREFLYNDTQLNYNANNVSFMASHLIKTPLKMAMRQSTDTDEGDLLLITNGEDGTMACFSVLRPLNVVAASEFVTDGSFIDVGVDVTDIYTVVTRTVNSATKQYLELFDSQRTTDCNLQYFSGATSPDQSLPGSTTVSSLSHLEAKTVKVLRDGFVLLDKTVSSSAITIDVAPSTYVEVGLDYTVEVKTLPSEPGLSTGPVQSRKRRIMEVTPILKSTQNVNINGFDVHFRTLSDTLGTTISSFSGRKRIGPLLGYSETAQITFSQSQPLFMTVLSVEYKLSTAAN